MASSSRAEVCGEEEEAELSFLAGDSFAEETLEQVGVCSVEERVQPARRSKEEALRALALVGSGGHRGTCSGFLPGGGKARRKSKASGSVQGAVPAGRSSLDSSGGGASAAVASAECVSRNMPVSREVAGDIASGSGVSMGGRVGSMAAGVSEPSCSGVSGARELFSGLLAGGPGDSCGSPGALGLGRGMSAPGFMSGAGGVPAGPFPGLFSGSWSPSWGAGSWGASSSGGGLMPSVSQWGGGVPGNMGLGLMPGCSYGSGWGVPVGMPGFCFPGPASVSWSPQVACILPGGQMVQTDGLGAVGSPGVAERPGGSGAERGSALTAGAVAGGGAAVSGPSSSLMPEVAVRGGSVQASDVSSLVGTAGQGVSGVSAGVSGASTTAPSSCSYSLWIVGHSFIHWASERACIRPGGRHLGLGHLGLRVSWWGQRGMHWSQLLVLLTDLRSRTSHPDILLIHLGGNDVDALTGKDLVNRIKDDLRVVWDWFPGVLLVWSDIVPRPSRIVSRRWTRGLAKLNRQVGKWVVGHGGWQIQHDWVDVNCLGLYHTDRVHLSDVGLDLLLDDFASSCEKFLSDRS
uniref:Uncharacterized PE-PGRS family protein PE_PGRS54-like isoform X2 n=2 Tax=Geotrypetes seraphini TaxID=260995 RepID=A0A6P8R0V4_GEOSA|nr:uncharacterized PE-PGRS family protein PE_PGRS54-like isoform X2 [Geotrypetes seraphini]